MVDASQKIVQTDKVKPYRSPRQKRQWRIVIVVLLLVPALGAGAYFLVGPRQESYTLRSFDTAVVTVDDLVQTTQSSGAVVLPVQMQLASPEEGYASEVLVTEGDAIAAGQIMGRIDVPSLADSLEDLRSNLEDARRSYDKTRTQNQITNQRKERQIAAIETDIANARADYERVADLVRAGASTQNDLDIAQRTLDELIASQQEQIVQLGEDRILAALDEESLLAAVTDLETEIERLLERIEATTIRSPMAGEVLEVEPALAVPGSLIANNQSLFTVADPSSALIELEVLEQYAGTLTTGETVNLTVGTASLTGTVIRIGKIAQQSSDGLGATVVVTVKPDSNPESLLVGSTAVGVLELATKEGAMLIPRGPYLTSGSQRYLYRIDGNTAQRISVTFGQIEGTLVEIMSGVEPGDQIITSGYQNFIEFEEINLDRRS